MKNGVFYVAVIFEMHQDLPARSKFVAVIFEMHQDLPARSKFEIVLRNPIRSRIQIGSDSDFGSDRTNDLHQR